MWRQALTALLVQALLTQVSQHFLQVLSIHQGLALRKAVCQQMQVRLAIITLALEGSDEVCGNQACTLMQQLMKGVLAVGASAAPDNRAGSAIHG